jgi:hypothetical protein
MENRSMASVASMDDTIQVDQPTARWGAWALIYEPARVVGLVAGQVGLANLADVPGRVGGLAHERAGPVADDVYPGRQADTVRVRIVRTYGGQTLHIDR